MTRKTSWLAPGKVTIILAVLASLFALGLPASVGAVAVENNTQSVNSMANQIIGTATSSNGGVALAGTAIAINVAPLPVQMNIQVDTTGNPNNVQTASNDATIDQTTDAISGDPTATNGGMAATGTAMATSTAIVMQVNIQVIMGNTPSDGVTQTAANDADIDQGTGAASGTSDADGGGSTATSGGASASSSAVVNQMNTQLYVGTGGTDTTGSVQQDLLNSAGVGQTVASLTGAASAASGGNATTGNVENAALTLLQQTGSQTVNE